MTPILDVSLEDLRCRRSLKWQRYGPDVLPMWVAEMDAKMPAAAAAAIEQALQLGDMGYPSGADHEWAFAEFAKDRWAWDVGVHQIRRVNDVMSGLRLLLRTLTKPGDAVVINPPVYPPFFSLVRDLDRELIEVPLANDRLDLDRLERCFASRQPKVHLLCSPHNPTGTVHTRDELERLAELAAEYRVRVIADEIHAPFGPAAHVPYASVDPHGIVVTSASKSWNLAALKCALMIGGTEAVEALSGIGSAETEDAVSHLADIAHTAAFSQDRGWLDQVRQEVADNRKLLLELLQTHLPQVSYAPDTGTYLAWLDCSELGLDDPAKFFLEKAHVAFVPGVAFGKDYAQFVRFNLATSPGIITEAVLRMALSLDSKDG